MSGLISMINFGEGQAPKTVAVAETTTEMLAANPVRKWALITNLSNRDIYAAIGKDAEIGKGFFLGRMGGFLELDANLMSLEAVNGIATGAGASVIFQEGV